MYAKLNKVRTKLIFLNDGSAGLLLGSMWDDYARLEQTQKRKNCGLDSSHDTGDD